ncbi:MAG: hypothetical protein L0215_19015 [Gemmataceae bacterium]|nr:hypothetical protein [Gemmataceae bacterium]
MARPLPADWRKDQVPQEFVELHAHLDQLPLHIRQKLMPLYERLGHYTRLQNRLVRVAQDAVDQLQLDLKYLAFDLEATRRERDELRQILDELEEHLDE